MFLRSDDGIDWSIQYISKEKRKLRQRLIRESLRVFRDKKIRILSLPSIEGHCVKFFRRLWPSSYILGIERNKMIVTSSELLDPKISQQHTTSFYPYRKTLNQYFCCSVSNIMSGQGIYEAIDSGNENLRSLRPVSSNFVKPFDIAYLDYTGDLENLATEAFNFMDKKMNAPSICGMTFSYDPSKFSTRLDIENYLQSQNPKRYKRISVETYKNGTKNGGSFMVFAIFEK